MDVGDFANLAQQVGSLVGEGEIALRKQMGDEWFENIKTNTMRNNEAVAELSEATVRRKNAEATLMTMASLCILLLTVAAITTLGVLYW